MGSNDHIPVPDPKPKPIAELLDDILYRSRHALDLDGNSTAGAKTTIDEDVPRLMKALEYAMIYIPAIKYGIEDGATRDLARILNGEEVK